MREHLPALCRAFSNPTFNRSRRQLVCAPTQFQNGQVTDLVASSRIVRAKMQRTVNWMVAEPGQYINVRMAVTPRYTTLIADMAVTAAIILT